jgi:virulence-associated protein VapD
MDNKTLTYASETSTLTKRDINNKLERKVYTRILGSVYDNEEENLRILTNKEMYAIV